MHETTTLFFSQFLPTYFDNTLLLFLLIIIMLTGVSIQEVTFVTSVYTPCLKYGALVG